MSPVELRDEQPKQHEIGNRTYIVADVAPLDVDGVRTVEVGTALWLVAFVAMLPFYGGLEDAGRVWWLWTCLSGFGLGLFGLEYCRRRKKARSRSHAHDAPPPAWPPTRWAKAGVANAGYGETFGRLVAEGTDVDGEARLADTLLPRGSRMLDAGSGMGRVGAALIARGHQVVGVEPYTALLEQSRRTFPDLPVLGTNILGVTDEGLAATGHPSDFDLVVCVGNVMVLPRRGHRARTCWPGWRAPGAGRPDPGRLPPRGRADFAPALPAGGVRRGRRSVRPAGRPARRQLRSSTRRARSTPCGCCPRRRAATGDEFGHPRPI